MHSKQHCGRASKGSQFHLQNLVNDYPEYLNCLILSSSSSLSAYASTHPKWVSPLASKDYTEYQDEQFLEVIDFPQLLSNLTDYWSSGGPVWDALATVKGKDGGCGVILVEAKSYMLELGNPKYACKARGKSLGKINNALSMVKRALGAKGEVDWTGEYYQYANRIAHLYFLNTIAHVPTWMIYLFFIGDTEQNGPSTVAEWTNAISEMKAKLGLPQYHLLNKRIVSVFALVERQTV